MFFFLFSSIGTAVCYKRIQTFISVTYLNQVFISLQKIYVSIVQGRIQEFVMEATVGNLVKFSSIGLFNEVLNPLEIENRV